MFFIADVKEASLLPVSHHLQLCELLAPYQQLFSWLEGPFLIFLRGSRRALVNVMYTSICALVFKLLEGSENETEHEKQILFTNA